MRSPRSRQSCRRRALSARSLVAGLALWPAAARAEEPVPATVYVPLQAVEFTRACPVGNPSGNAALRCGMFGDVVLEPFSADSAVLEAAVEAIRGAVAPFAIQIVTEPPPVYLPHYILVLSNHVVEDDDDDRVTCVLTSPGSTCEALDRNGGAAVVAAITQPEAMTTSCEAPDVVSAALYGLGRLAGLEGSDGAEDPMLFPPDWTVPKTAYQDACAALTVDAPACGAIHGRLCADDAGRQNSHQELLAAFGSAPDAPDTEPPVLADVVPADGATYMAGAGSEIVMDATISDDSDIVGVRWTIAGAPLDKVDTREPGTLTRCTNDVCDTNWGGRWIDRRASTQDWSFETALAPGEYTITLEASDLAGNTAMSAVTITVDDPPPDPPDDGDDDPPPPDPGDTAGSDGGSEDDDSDPGDGGCSCRGSGAAPSDGLAAALGLVGWWHRRRRVARRALSRPRP